MLFWSLPKKPPHSIEYYPEIELHRQYIADCSCFEATIYNIDLNYILLKLKLIHKYRKTFCKNTYLMKGSLRL